MNHRRLMSLSAAFALAAFPAGLRAADAKKDKDESDGPPEDKFRVAAFILLNRPNDEKVKDAAKVVTIFVLASKDVQVGMSGQAMECIGLDKEDDRSFLLMAAFMAGNALGQLDTGVNANDPYSGYVQLFRMYRALQKADGKFKRPKIDDLLKIHREGKLMEHLAKTEDTKHIDTSGIPKDK